MLSSSSVIVSPSSGVSHTANPLDEPLLKKTDFEHGDLRGAAQAIKVRKQVFSAVATCATTCCDNLCLCCKNCIQAIGDCCEYLAKAAWVNGYNGILRPVGMGAAEFFRAKNGKLKLWQPAVDVVAGAVGNPLTVFVLDPLFATEEGSDTLSFEPLANPIGRIIEFFGFITNIATCANPRENMLAAMIIFTLSTYFAMTAAGPMASLITEGLSWDLINPLSILNPAANYHAIKAFMSGNPIFWQKLVVSATAYFGAVHGHAAGKKLINFDYANWHQQFNAAVTHDALKRHLDDLEKMDEETAKQAHAIYQTAAEQGKNWKVVDVIGRGAEQLFKLPAHLFQGPSHNLWNITGAKAWLKVQGMLPSRQKVKDKAKATASACAKGFMRCLGRRTRVTAKADHYNESKEMKAPIPSFEEIMQQRKQSYSRLAVAGNQSLGFITRDVRDGRQRKLDKEMEARYYQDVVQKGFKGDDFIPYPIIPEATSSFTPPPPYNEAWVQEVNANTNIQGMLKGDFPCNSATLAEKAKLYHECVYAVYTGQSHTVTKLVESAAKPPAYAPDEESGISLTVTMK